MKLTLSFRLLFDVALALCISAGAYTYLTSIKPILESLQLIRINQDRTLTWVGQLPSPAPAVEKGKPDGGKANR